MQSADTLVENIELLKTLETEFPLWPANYMDSFERFTQHLLMACAERLSVQEFKEAIDTAKRRMRL